jgi:hypothetical protein
MDKVYLWRLAPVTIQHSPVSGVNPGLTGCLKQQENDGGGRVKGVP